MGRGGGRSGGAGERGSEAGGGVGAAGDGGETEQLHYTTVLPTQWNVLE